MLNFLEELPNFVRKLLYKRFLEKRPADRSEAASKIQAGFRGYKDRKNLQQKKRAVVTIQANVRGFLVRRRLIKMRRLFLQNFSLAYGEIAWPIITFNQTNSMNIINSDHQNLLWYFAM